MNKSELVSIRNYEPLDKNFILATFLRGLYHGETWYSEVPKQIFMENYHKIIEFIMTIPTNQIKVACLKDDKDVILGYSIFSTQKKAVHWVFIKKSWRGIGIAKDLVPSDTVFYTHFTKVGQIIMKKKNLTLNPFAL